MIGMISAIVLAHNDADGIQKTLESLRFCSELILIDDDSADNTRDIARKFGAKVYQRPLGDDFAGARNFGLSKAKGEWVLFADSDEIITPELAAEIQKSVARTEKNGFFIKRRDFLFGSTLKHGETSRVNLLRLGRKNFGKWVRPVHEVWQIDGKTGQLMHPILHYPHPNVAQFISDTNRYSTINAGYLFETGIRTSWWQIMVYPAAKFIREYIYARGFLDGMPGMVLAVMMSFHSFLTRSKLYLLWNSKRKDYYGNNHTE